MRTTLIAIFGALLVALGLIHPAPGQPVASPTTAPPRFLVVSGVALDEQELALFETRSIVVDVQGKPRVIVDVSAVRHSLKTCRIWTAAGKELTAVEALQRLKPGQTVLLASHGQKPDPAFLRVLKEDTLILVARLEPGVP